MTVYVVCSHVEWDSHHQCVLVTLDKDEAEKLVLKENAKHDPDCETQRPTESDGDECFCKRLHMHKMTLSGHPPYWLHIAPKSAVDAEMSDND